MLMPLLLYMQVTGNPLLPLGNDIIDAALLEVQHYLEDQMQTLSNYGMRVPRAATRVDAGLQRLRDEELAYDQVALAAEVEQNLQLLNADQRAVWEAVRGALDDERPQVRHATRSMHVVILYGVSNLHEVGLYLWYAEQYRLLPE